MAMADSEIQSRLIAAARTAARHAYAPYSGYHVGAALLLDDGEIVTGANVENASYGLTLCAETVAVAKLANMGALARLRAVAIIGGRPHDEPIATGDELRLIGAEPVHPCGRCRQMLNEAAEVARTDIAVYCASGDGSAVANYRLSDLLPHGFGPKDLGLV
jgi:cytidine deaminase